MILERTIWICITFCTASVRPLAGNSWKQAATSPIIQHKPFVVVWNLPTTRCQEHFGIRLPLDVYGIVENKGNVFQGQNMTIFYKNKFGLYPYISPQGDWHNGGIPQKVNLKRHLEKATKEITELLNNDFQGLAVVDWEEWRPLWRRNWMPKMVYKEASKQWVTKRFPGLSPEEQTYLAKAEFEKSARLLMETTLALGKKLRPHGFWGFYRFPDCFNGKWGKEVNYTGHCNPKEVRWNDQLMWLWEISSALYPSIYLPLKLPALYRQHYVHHRLREASRVAQFGKEHPLPVLPYSRVSYRHSSRYLTETDLINTIGESAALGSAGVVLWGDLSYSSSLARCKSLHHYINTTLGPYVANVTTAAHRCSRQLCHGNGRCVRHYLNELEAFLHLDHHLWEGDLGMTDSQDQNVSAQDHFQCHCYPKWAGTHCERPQMIEPFKKPKHNQASQYNNVYDTVHDGDFDLGSNICPTSIYGKETER
ncbi:hyaluronidase-3 [Crotalus tigris]|uniref:hyaluronidase-3 n=1 Tax=Crotalus tigris TaxID=88082 RepID=UPI00192F498C|nr:hyaluronidase-3 [Crotalus tigris]XP_039214625.1 hyaluronidase-3 [Crotalus tigris]XP_039214627.1 hyaluronidase-3 [Crotalus tigris]